jgi:hypothetical protein
MTRTRKRFMNQDLQLIPLRGQHQLLVERQAGHDAVALVGRDGVVRIRIAIDQGGASISVEAGSIALRAAGDLAIEAERVSLHGRQQVSVTTGAGATIDLDHRVAVVAETILLNS